MTIFYTYELYCHVLSYVICRHRLRVIIGVMCYIYLYLYKCFSQNTHVSLPEGNPPLPDLRWLGRPMLYLMAPGVSSVLLTFVVSNHVMVCHHKCAVAICNVPVWFSRLFWSLFCRPVQQRVLRISTPTMYHCSHDEPWLPIKFNQDQWFWTNHHDYWDSQPMPLTNREVAMLNHELTIN